jgi:hypothetical protein
MLFDTLKKDCLDATDFELHFAALVVFNELTTRRLGGNMTTDASGNAVVIVPTTARKPRTKTPKKAIGDKHDEPHPPVSDQFFHPPIVIGDEVELGGVATAPPEDESQEYQSISPEPHSDPRPIVKKTGGKATKSRDQ